MTTKSLVQPGDILFYKVSPKSALMSKLVAIAQLLRGEGKTFTSYSHVSLVDNDINYQLESRLPKTRRSTINWDDPSIEVWRVRDVSNTQIILALKWGYNNLNKWYDLGQICLGLFKSRNTYTCAEFVYNAYKDSVDLASDAGKVIGPNELIDSGNLYKVILP